MQFSNLKKFINSLDEAIYAEYQVLITSFEEGSLVHSPLMFIGMEDKDEKVILVDQNTFKQFPDDEQTN